MDDVPSLDFVVGHGLSKKVTNEHFYMKEKSAFNKHFCSRFSFVLFRGLGLVAIRVDEFLYHFVVMMWMMVHHLIL